MLHLLFHKNELNRIQLYITILCCLVFDYSFANNKSELKIDSLFGIARNTSLHDTSRAQAYLTLSEMLYVTDLDTIEYLCNRALEICDRNNLQGILTPVKKALITTKADALNNLGYYYGETGKITQRFECYERSIELRKIIKDKKGLAVSLSNLASTYLAHGDAIKAINLYNESLNIRKENNDKRGIAILLNNLAFIYEEQEDFEKTLELYEESLKYRTELKDERGIAICLNNIGALYDVQGKYGEALLYYNKSLAKKKELKDPQGEANVLNNIGFIYRQLNQHDKAIEYYKKSLEIREKLDHKKGVAISLNNLAAAYFETQQYDQALQYALRSFEIANQMQAPKQLMHSASTLYSIYKNSNKHKKALEMYELHVQMRDSLKNEETQKASIRQQTKYEFEKAQLIAEQNKNEQVREQNEALKRRNNLQYSIILVAIIAVFTFTLSIGKVKVSPKFAEGLIFFAFLILFEFLLVLTDPYVDNITSGAPAYKLFINAFLAAIIFPAHAYFERKFKSKFMT